PRRGWFGFLEIAVFGHAAAGIVAKPRGPGPRRGGRPSRYGCPPGILGSARRPLSPKKRGDCRLIRVRLQASAMLSMRAAQAPASEAQAGQQVVDLVLV